MDQGLGLGVKCPYSVYSVTLAITVLSHKCNLTFFFPLQNMTFYKLNIR